MLKILCNVARPDLGKIASMTGHKITNVHTAGSVLLCKLDGASMPVTVARAKMLAGQGVDFVFVNHSGYPVSV
jgi:hypothetical protein